MRKDLGDLAARFRAAMDQEATQREAEEAARRARLSEAAAARTALLTDLAAFGQQAGVACREDGGAVVLAHGDREVRFEGEGEGDLVRVTWPDMAHRSCRLYREPALQDRWVLAVTRGRDEDRVPLVEQGLVWLLVERLGLPGPSLTAPAPEKGPSRATAAPEEPVPSAPSTTPKRRL